ncbi:hypothetical protein JANAI62_03130 [Jannaschia pagri]|uniref:Methyltransferase domain-containing protein n=1 Tax=Jannaschia pagri TaxID=2829797 RepID=A0ABQ4NHM5_9RHOB|nr:hypothetical protein JANAI62_03130 [Jannaschia sp. AI_62]
MTDAETIAVYAAKACDYEAMGQDTDPDRATFLAALPDGDGPILDWGCGPGHDAQAFAAAGATVEATDATAEMVALARQKGVDARQEVFADLPTDPRYRGIWANFSLLHADEVEVPGLVERAAQALCPGGVLHVAMKRGAGMQRDALGRRYTYVEASDLDRMTGAAGLTPFSRREGKAMGLDGHAAGYIVHLSRKDHD